MVRKQKEVMNPAPYHPYCENCSNGATCQDKNKPHILAEKPAKRSLSTNAKYFFCSSVMPKITERPPWRKQQARWFAGDGARQF